MRIAIPQQYCYYYITILANLTKENHMQFNMLEAKTNLSRIVKDIEDHRVSEVILARGGKPVAKIVPYDKPPAESRLGGGKRKYPDLVSDRSILSYASLSRDDDDIATGFRESVDDVFGEEER